MKPSDYLPPETLEEIWTNLEASEKDIKKLEAGIADMKKVGIDVLAREETLKTSKETYAKWRAVYGYRPE